MSSEAKPVENFVEHPKTLAELRAGILAGTTKAVDLAASYYERIAQKNPRLNVYLSLTKERALAQAARRWTIWPPRAIRCLRWLEFLWASRMCW